MRRCVGAVFMMLVLWSTGCGERDGGAAAGPNELAGSSGAADSSGAAGSSGSTQVAWQYESKTGYRDMLLSVARRDGQSLVVGTNASGSMRGAVAQRFSPQGSLAWTTRLGPSHFDEARAVEIGPAGEIYVAASVVRGSAAGQQHDVQLSQLDLQTGETLGAFAPFEQQGAEDIFAVRISPDGEQTGVRQRGTAGLDMVTSVAIDGQGRVFVSGSTEGELVKGQAAGGRDALLLHVVFSD